MKKDKLPGFVVIAGLTTLTTILWVAVAVFFKLKTEEKINVPEEIVNPINPSLDFETLNKISGMFYVEESEIPNSVVTASVKPTNTATPRPTTSSSLSASPSATPNSSLTPTPSAQP